MQRVGAMLVAAAMVTAGATAEMRVVPEAAWRGGFGLRAEVTAACPGEVAILVLGPIVTVQRVEACQEIFVGDATVESGGRLEAVAGERVVLGDGFSVAEGGELALGTGDGWEPGYAVEESPAGEARLFVRSYVRLDDVGLEPGGAVTILGIEDGMRERGRVRYEAAVGGGWLWAEVTEDDGEKAVTERTWLGPGWQLVELEWEAGPVTTAGGGVAIRVEGAEVAALEGLKLGLGLVEGVRMGAWDGSDLGGWVDFDEVAAARTGAVGPAQ